MKLQRAHHRWFIGAVLWSVLIVPGDAVLGVLGSPGGWLLVLSVPMAVLNWCGWHATRPTRPRPDYVLIARLERELLDVKPQPPPGPGAAAPSLPPLHVDPLLIRYEKR